MKKIESLYLHFPFCAHLCNYCDFYKKVPQNKSQDFKNFHDYLQSAFNEHEKLMKENGYSWAPLKTLYIGGGTPSLWGMEGKEFLENFLKKNNLKLSAQCEFTMEVNPGAWEESILNEWEKIGVNRYSLGIQSLDAVMSKYLDRVHSINDVYDTLDFFQKKKVNFSVDFMLGLPYSSDQARDVIAELTKALKYSPSHFSVYILTVKDNYTHHKKLPNEEWIQREYLEVAEFLKSRNFNHYEVSNFALPNKESHHNLNYWRSATVAALGPSASGFFAEKKLRYKWKTNSPTAEIENLSNSEFQLEKTYLALRSSIGLDLKSFKSEFNDLNKLALGWRDNGYALINTDQILTLTSKGFLILDSLMNELFMAKIIK